jgi:hypothetical protein
MKKIMPVAKEYERVKMDRCNLTVKEKELKTQLLSLIKESGVKPLADGSIRLCADGISITVTPRDELVKVKDELDNE